MNLHSRNTGLRLELDVIVMELAKLRAKVIELKNAEQITQGNSYQTLRSNIPLFEHSNDREITVALCFTNLTSSQIQCLLDTVPLK